jgi:hypothetical protein
LGTEWEAGEMWDFGRRLFEPFVVSKRISVCSSMSEVAFVLSNAETRSRYPKQREREIERDGYSPLSRNYTPLVPLQSMPHSAR